MELTLSEPTKAENTIVMYRYSDYVTVSGYCDDYDNYHISSRTVRLRLEEYSVIKTTAKGVWIRFYESKSQKRFILLGTRRQFCFMTIDEAAFSFQKRKEKQITIYRARIAQAEIALRLSKEGLTSQSDLPFSLGRK